MKLLEIAQKGFNFGADFTLASGLTTSNEVRNPQTQQLLEVKIHDTDDGEWIFFKTAGTSGVWLTEGHGDSGYIQPKNGLVTAFEGRLKIAPNASNQLTITMS